MQHLHQAIQRCPRVAVYGTLKRGHRNHHWLNGADMLGQDCLCEITLYDLGPYPGAKLTPSAGVIVEVYAIDAERLARLDELEDYLPLAPRRRRVRPDGAGNTVWRCVVLYLQPNG